MNLKTLSKLKPRERLPAIVTGRIAGDCPVLRAARVPAGWARCLRGPNSSRACCGRLAFFFKQKTAYEIHR